MASSPGNGPRSALGFLREENRKRGDQCNFVVYDKGLSRSAGAAFLRKRLQTEAWPARHPERMIIRAVCNIRRVRQKSAGKSSGKILEFAVGIGLSTLWAGGQDPPPLHHVFQLLARRKDMARSFAAMNHPKITVFGTKGILEKRGVRD